MSVENQLRMVLIYSIIEMGGFGRKCDVLSHIQDNKYWYKNDDNDEDRASRPEKKWRNNFAYARQHLAREGYIRNAVRDNWELMPSGYLYAYALADNIIHQITTEKICFSEGFLLKLQDFVLHSDDSEDRMLIREINRELSENKPRKRSNLINKPLPKGPAVDSNNRRRYATSTSVSINALERAGHLCEINENHPSFQRRNSEHLYMEAHHLIPVSKTDDFDVSLDREQNIVSLCSNCHNEIHYGTPENIRLLLQKLFLDRKDALCSILGRQIDIEELYKIYNV